MGDTKKAADTLTRIAEYQCTQTHYTKVFRPYGIEGEDERVSGRSTISQTAPVTIRVISNESAAETKDRFEQAAEIELRGMLFRNEMSDCSGHQFVRFLSTAQEVLKTDLAPNPAVLAGMATAYGDAINDCQKATGSYVMCKPMP